MEVTMYPRDMSQTDLERLGGGDVAYIKTLTSEEANNAYPLEEPLPKGVTIFALHAADGTPIALTDSLGAAHGQAIEDELNVVPIH